MNIHSGKEFSLVLFGVHSCISMALPMPKPPKTRNYRNRTLLFLRDFILVSSTLKGGGKSSISPYALIEDVSSAVAADRNRYHFIVAGYAAIL
jgi:hypothetical protein